MGTFAETANVDYHLSFADQGKQTPVFRCLAANEIYLLIYIFMPFYEKRSIEKRKTRYRLLILSFILTKNQTEVTRLQMN